MEIPFLSPKGADASQNVLGIPPRDGYAPRGFSHFLNGETGEKAGQPFATASDPSESTAEIPLFVVERGLDADLPVVVAQTPPNSSAPESTSVAGTAVNVEPPMPDQAKSLETPVADRPMDLTASKLTEPPTQKMPEIAFSAMDKVVEPRTPKKGAPAAAFPDVATQTAQRAVANSQAKLERLPEHLQTSSAQAVNLTSTQTAAPVTKLTEPTHLPYPAGQAGAEHPARRRLPTVEITRAGPPPAHSAANAGSGPLSTRMPPARPELAGQDTLSGSKDDLAAMRRSPDPATRELSVSPQTQQSAQGPRDTGATPIAQPLQISVKGDPNDDLLSRDAVVRADGVDLRGSEQGETRSTVQSNAPTPLPGLGQTNQMRVVAQVNEALIQMREGTIKITLNPQELGTVELTMRGSDSNLSILVQAERPEILNMLKRNIDMLATQMRELGYDDPTFEFSERDDNRQNGHASDKGAGEIHRVDLVEYVSEEHASANLAAPKSASHGATSVDIRR